MLRTAVCLCRSQGQPDQFQVPGTAPDFFTDMHRVLRYASLGPVKSFCHHRWVTHILTRLAVGWQFTIGRGAVLCCAVFGDLLVGHQVATMPCKHMCETPAWTSLTTRMSAICTIPARIGCPPCRLILLEQKFNLYVMLNALCAAIMIPHPSHCALWCLTCRLMLLEQKFNLHVMLNADKEFLAQKSAPHRDFYNVRKVRSTTPRSASCLHEGRRDAATAAACSCAAPSRSVGRTTCTHGGAGTCCRCPKDHWFVDARSWTQVLPGC